MARQLTGGDAPAQGGPGGGGFASAFATPGYFAVISA